MLEPGSALRRVWMAGAAALVALRRPPRRPRRSACRACARRSPTTRTSTRAWPPRCASPPVQAQLRRCPLLSLPDNKLIPDARWILDSVGQHDIVARSQARADVEQGARTRSRTASSAGSVAVYPLGSAVFFEAIVDVGDDPRDQVPLARLQTHLHEPLLRGVWQLLRRSRGPVRPGPTVGVGGPGGRARRRARRCACGASGRGCPTPTTPTRPTTSCRTRSACSGTSLNPDYFANPPAFTYVLHYLFAVCLRGHGTGCGTRSRRTPADVYTLARVAAAVLGTVALWLLYATGARLFGRGVGLLAAAIEAVAFLPVFYAHLALNDVPTLAPLTLSLLGSAGVLRKGRARDHLLAGVGLGLACATKYTAGIVLVPYLRRGRGALPGRGGAAGRRAPGAARWTGLRSPGRRRSLAFLIANPYALLDYAELPRANSSTSRRCPPKPRASSAPRGRAGSLYYLWSLTWGLGWVPALAALGGRCDVWRARARARLAARARAAAVPRASWASRAATSAAGCCRSSRSCACSRRSSRCRRVAALGAGRVGPPAERAGRRSRGGRHGPAPGAARRAALRLAALLVARAARPGARSTASTPASCSRARTPAT